MSIFRNNNVDSSTSDIPFESRNCDMEYSENIRGKSFERQDNFSRLDASDVVEPSLKHPSHQGRNTLAFWTLVLLLFLLAVANLTLTFIILGVLRLGQGMESLELVPEESLIKFYGTVDLDQVYKRDGKIESFNESPLTVTGDQGPVHVGIVGVERLNPQIVVGVNQTQIKNIESFEVRHPVTGLPLFSTDFPNFGLPRGVVKLDVKIALTKRVASPVDESLHVQADSVIRLKGNEGTHMDGKEIIWSADQDIFLKSVNGSIVLSGGDGVSVDVKSIPIALGSREATRSYAQYKLCVCMPKGKLFRVPIPPGQGSLVGCHTIDLSLANNPCL